MSITTQTTASSTPLATSTTNAVVTPTNVGLSSSPGTILLLISYAVLYQPNSEVIGTSTIFSTVSGSDTGTGTATGPRATVTVHVVNNSSNAASIAGALVGGIVLGALFVAVLLFFIVHRNRKETARRRQQIMGM
ncbi:hypothetical protein CPB85DRAFT_1293379 [Mucidula mucida]|nr:hypothetical protein CPB85DRAFT_1293379 [Mucidula mucida]